jgi:GNAT superfamily N-acetyltransferase
MLKVAHPAWRQHLAKEARKIPSIQGIEVLSPRLVSLRDGRRATVRPATNADIPAIKAYIEKLSDRDRLTRYMGGSSVEFLTNSARLNDLYEKTLDYLEHAAFLMESRGEIIGISHAFQTSEGVYETSFSRRSDLQGLGIGSHLMDFLEDWGLSAEVVELNAMTYRTQNPRMRNLFDKRGFKVRTHPEDPTCVLYSTDYQSIALRRA